MSAADGHLDGTSLQPVSLDWATLAADAYQDAASMGFDHWDPATIYWRGLRDAAAAIRGVTTADVTEELRHG